MADFQVEVQINDPVYNEAFDLGYKVGFDEAYWAGHSAGYDEGWQAGYDAGYLAADSYIQFDEGGIK